MSPFTKIENTIRFIRLSSNIWFQSEIDYLATFTVYISKLNGLNSA